MAARTRPGATPTRCGACGQPVIRQHVEVLTVTVNAVPIPAGTDNAHRDPNHLTWCALPQATGPPRLRWIYGWHPDPCPHPHHAEHRCTTRKPTPQQTAQPGLF
jgi:hypothetical protein